MTKAKVDYGIEPSGFNPKTVEVDSKHRIYYRATQVGLSAPCYKRPALDVGMRVAILETRSEFTSTIPEPKWYAATVIKIGEGANPLVTFQYEYDERAQLMAAMDSIARFCVVIPKGHKRKKRMKR